MNQHDYLRILTEQIRCERARPMIEEEFQEHIEEQKLDFMAEGMTEHEAEEAAVREMGDPVDVGVQLDRIHRPKLDRALIGAIMGLATMGICAHVLLTKLGEMINGNNEVLTYDMAAITITMVVWTLMGAILMAVIYYVDYTILGKYALWIWGAVAVGLCGYRIFGNIVNGGYPMKAGFVSMMVPVYAGIVYYYRGKGKSGFWKSILFLLISVVLFVVIPGPVSSGIVLLFFLTGTMVLIAAIKKRWFGAERKKQALSLLGVFLMMFFVVIQGTNTQIVAYQRERLKTMSTEFQQYKVQIEAAYGELSYLEKELEEGAVSTETEGSLQAGIDWWNTVRSDYVWVFIFECLGNFFGIVCIAMLGWLFFWIFQVVHRQKNQLGYIISLGCGIMLLLQTLAYAAVNVGLLPPGTITMPFFTYGRSNIVITYLYMGLFLTISRNERVVPAR